MILATCLTIAAALTNAQGGETIRLTGDCPTFTIVKTYNPPITIEALGSTVRGLKIVNGGGVTWRGGDIRAPVGYDSVGYPGYGAFLSGANGVTFEGTKFGFSNKAMVVNSSKNIAVRFSRFEIGGDAIIAAGGSNYDFSYNQFVNVAMRPTRCTITIAATAEKAATTTVTEGLSSRDCIALGGKWADGWHQDAIQIRNGITNVVMLSNVITEVAQGIGQMEASTDAPLYGVYAEGNDIAVSGFHSITIGAKSTGVVIINNKVRQTTGRRTIIRAGTDAIVCGNDVQRIGDPGALACK